MATPASSARLAGDGGALPSGGTAALTVTRATLTVTATSVSRSYGVGNGPLTVAYSGFVNGEGEAALRRPTNHRDDDLGGE